MENNGAIITTFQCKFNLLQYGNTIGYLIDKIMDINPTLLNPGQIMKADGNHQPSGIR